MENQRFVMGPEKEKNMFLSRVGGQLDRMEKSRITSQDASFVREEKRTNDIEAMLGTLAPRLHEQSAVFRKSATFAKPAEEKAL